MTSTRKRLACAAVAATLLVPAAVVSAAASQAAHPTKADVISAKARLATLDRQLGVVVERYDAARVTLQRAQQQLATAKTQMQHDQSIADAARTQLGQRAVQAYTSMGSQADTLLGASSLSQFSDRLEFMTTIAQSDADLATSAEASRQQAAWATRQYGTAVSRSQAQLTAVGHARDQVTQLLAQAQTLYRQTSSNYQSFLAAQRRALARQRAQDAAGTTATVGSAAGSTSQPGNGNGNGNGNGGGGGSTPPPPPPPTNLQGAAAAIAAAKSVLGVQYVFDAADPSVGFDCSGLTMWSWAHAGVSLPHSAAMQYDALPHIALSQLEPGDLIFFYSPISHVAMYLGGGLIIHATHPGPGGEVHIEALSPIWTPLITGAARP